MPATQLPSNPIRCFVCQRAQPERNLVAISPLRHELVQRLEKTAGKPAPSQAAVCAHCLNTARVAHVLERLEGERGELSDVEADIARRAVEHITTRRIEQQLDAPAGAGQRLADSVARVGGSWPFVLGFLLALVVWMLVNTVFLAPREFDPYPYILLNLVLSCLAAIQAPIIMMSQNRTAERDRLRAENDYEINLKAELEVATLHEKVDHLLHSQWQHMVEIQRTQLELLEQLNDRPSSDALPRLDND